MYKFLVSCVQVSQKITLLLAPLINVMEMKPRFRQMR
jgi:hypothetical protein